MVEPSVKPVVFLAFANAREGSDRHLGYLRNLPEEARHLERTLEQAQRDGLCELVVKANVTVDQIFDIFQQYRDRIALFHYGGHANSYQLLFETRQGKTAPADAGALARFLAQQKGLKLVFLNGCSTEPQAQGLREAGVPIVIATSRVIDDRVATNFADRFYRGLVTGASIHTAFVEASAASEATVAGRWRHLGVSEQDGRQIGGQAGWALYQMQGAEEAARWNLPDAVGDCLFGLPTVPKSPLPRKPFRNLAWFRREDAEIFFGRGCQIRRLYQAVTAPDRPPIILFCGQAGVGKSSLLAAGLFPRLEESCAIRYRRREQETGLLAALEQALGGAVPAQGWASAWRATEEREGKPLVVILDQVEEVYSHPVQDPEQEMAGVAAVAREIFVEAEPKPEGKLILSFRSERLDKIETRLAKHNLWFLTEVLERLDRRGIIEAITGPARDERLRAQYKLRIPKADAALPGLIADDLLADQGAAVAPTLQILLSKMWERATPSDGWRKFNQELYDRMREQGLGLDDFLDEQLASLGTDHRQAVEAGLALDLLHYHVSDLTAAATRDGEELAAHYAHQEEERLQALVQGCVDRFLLVKLESKKEENEFASRLAHDTLGPVVRDRFDRSDLPGQRARRILESRAVEWACEEEDATAAEGTPLDAADLAVVEQGAPGMRAWTRGEAALVQASRMARDRAEAEEKERREREQKLERDRAEALRERAEAERLRAEEGEKAAHSLRRRLILAAIIGLLAIAAAAAAVWFGVDASKQRDNTEIALVTATVAQGQAEDAAEDARVALVTATVAQGQAEANAAIAEDARATAQAEANQRLAQAQTAQAADPFVRAHGNQFMVAGKPFKFIGVTTPGLLHYGYESWRFATAEDREEQLQAATEMGARVVKVYLPINDATASEVSERLGEVLELIDTKHPDLYLVLVLTDGYSSSQFHVPGDTEFFQIGPTGVARYGGNFYAEGYKKNYLPFVEHIVKEFRAEPHILAWQIGEELAYPEDPELFVEFNRQVADAIQQWDPNHLVTTGMLSTRHANLRDREAMLFYGGGNLQSGHDMLLSSDIDFITFGSYNECSGEDDDSALADRLGKPFVVTLGFEGQLDSDRGALTRDCLDHWFSRGASGAIQWGFMATQGDIGDGDYVFGMDQVFHADWDSLFALYQEYARDLQ